MANTRQAIGGAMSGAAAGSAIMPGVGTAIGGLIGGITGLFSGDGDDQREKQLQMLQQIQAEIDSIPLPPIEAQQLVLEKYRQAGVLTPEMEATITQGPSRMEQVSTDPRLKTAQMGVLSKLAQLGEQGLSAEDRMVFDELTRQTAQQEQARQQGILQNMAARGMGGSGAELAAQLSSSQAAADRQSREGMNLAAQAQKNALNAILQRGSLAGELRSQDFGEQAKIASAADEIARFNAANRQSIEGRNVGARNAAQEFNLRSAQDISDRNVSLSNYQQQHNKQLLQRRFDNQLAKARAKGAASGDIANFFGKEGDREDRASDAMMSGFGTVASGVASRFNTDKFDAKTGQALYNTKTGQQYKKEE